ncbi:MAG: transposase [Dehalococcoidia bacterium]|nr:transposase [Dehalococcoidia bacterium]
MEVENSGRRFKRGLTGIYHSVEVEHLDRYLDEFKDRYSSRKWPTLRSSRRTFSALRVSG